VAGRTRDIAGYRDAELIGQGGFAAVYKAADAAHGRDVAIKVLEGALGDVAPGQVVQFERLGYFAADLDDPSVFHRTVGLRDEWANIQKRAGR